MSSYGVYNVLYGISESTRVELSLELTRVSAERERLELEQKRLAEESTKKTSQTAEAVRRVSTVGAHLQIDFKALQAELARLQNENEGNTSKHTETPEATYTAYTWITKDMGQGGKVNRNIL